MKKLTGAALSLLLTLSLSSIAYCAQEVKDKNIILSPAVGQTQNAQLRVQPKIFKTNIHKENLSPKKAESVKTTIKDVTPALGKPIAKATSKEATPAQAKPAPKPMGKSYLPPVPASKNYMQAPYAANYKLITKTNYSLYVPNAFGNDPLSSLPGVDGPMLVRVKDNATYMAVTVIDPTDTVSYKATEPLPRFPNKKPELYWTMGNKEPIKCSAGSYSGFYGNIMVMEASLESKGRTYELLFSFPVEELYSYLPHVLYSLYTFQVK